MLVAFDHYDAKSRSTLLQVGASSASRFAKPRSADWLRPPTIKSAVCLLCAADPVQCCMSFRQ